MARPIEAKRQELGTPPVFYDNLRQFYREFWHRLMMLGVVSFLFYLPQPGWAQDEFEPAAAEAKPTPLKPTIERTSVPSRLGYIDEHLQKAWEAAGVRPSNPCTDAEFLRRAFLDLLGRVPNVRDAQAFLESKEPTKRGKLIDYLLAHPDYSKNFGLVYTNLLVGRSDRDRQIDRAALTAWLRKQFSENRPWNETAFELISAKGSNKENGAVNFSLAHFADEKVNLTSFTTRIFLGQQIQCTQCHDHPENSWKQQDFWGINAFYRGTRSRPVERVDDTGAVVNDGMEVYDEPTDEWARFENRKAIVGVVPPTYLDGRRISPGTDVDRRTELGKLITEPENDQFARAFVNRMWGHLLGRGMVHPVDDFGDHNPAATPELLDRLAADFRESGYDVKALIRWITACKAYNISSATTRQNQQDERLFSHYSLKPLTPEQLFDSLLTATSAHTTAGAVSDQLRANWARQFTVTFGNDEATETSTFQGTIPQALMMMNGELMAKATGGKSGSFLGYVLEQAQLQRKTSPVRFAVDQIYLAALGRYPTPAELKRASAFLDDAENKLEVIQDLFWSLLNSSEFILNH
jgi:hypothetical protein